MKQTKKLTTATPMMVALNGIDGGIFNYNRLDYRR